MQGRSLVPLLNGSGVATWQERPAITQAMVDTGPPGTNQPKPHFGIIDHGWKLVRKEVAPEPQEELYQHPIDNLNLTNVIKSQEPASHLKGLNETLERWKSQAGAVHLRSDEGAAKEVGSEELRRLRALGYVGGGIPSQLTTNGMAVTNTVRPGRAPIRKRVANKPTAIWHE